MSRRRRGEGTIKKRTDGGIIRYESRLSHEGKTRSLYARTEDDAVRNLDALKALRATGRWHVDVQETVGGMLDAWMRHVENRGAAWSTRRTYRIMAKNLKPLDPIRLDRLTTPEIQSFYAAMTAAGKSAATVGYCHRMLVASLNLAVKWRIITWNPAAAAEPPAHTPRHAPTITPEELATLWRQTAGTRWHALWMVFGRTGVRLSEATALRWEQIDWLSGKVQLTDQTQYRPGEGWYFTDLKTDQSRRPIYLDDATLAALRTHAAIQEQMKQEAGTWHEHGLIFTAPDGLPVKPRAVHHALERDLLRQSITGVTPHSFRHTVITLLLTDSVPLHEVSGMVGHARPATTLNVYAHVLPTRREALRGRMGDIVERSVDESAEAEAREGIEGQ